MATDHPRLVAKTLAVPRDWANKVVLTLLLFGAAALAPIFAALRWVSWFAVDILKCEKCGGRLRIVEVAKKPDEIARVLNERGYARAPPRAPPDADPRASAHGQLRLVFG